MKKIIKSIAINFNILIYINKVILANIIYLKLISVQKFPFRELKSLNISKS